MAIPAIVEKNPYGKVGKPLYFCMVIILPIVVLLVFGALVYRKIKEVQDENMALNEDDLATNETLKDVNFRAKILLGISAVTISSLIIYSIHFVSTKYITLYSNSPYLTILDDVKGKAQGHNSVFRNSDLRNQQFQQLFHLQIP